MIENPKIRTTVQWTGLLAGPVLAGIFFLVLPTEYRDANDRVIPLAVAGRVTLAVMVWMAVWWLTEAIHISATAMLPLVLLPTFQAASMPDAAEPYRMEVSFARLMLIRLPLSVVFLPMSGCC